MSIDNELRKITPQQFSRMADLLGRIFPDIFQTILPSHSFILMDTQRMIWKQLNTLYHLIVFKTFAHGMQVFLEIAPPRYKYITQPERFSMRLEPIGRLQCPPVVMARQPTMTLRINLFYIQQHKIGLRQQRLNIGIPHRSVRIETDMDTHLM